MLPNLDIEQLEELVRIRHDFTLEEAIIALADIAEVDRRAVTVGLVLGLAWGDPYLEGEDCYLIERVVYKYPHKERLSSIASYIFERFAQESMKGGVQVFDLIERVRYYLDGYALDFILAMSQNPDADKTLGEEFFKWYRDLCKEMRIISRMCLDRGISHYSLPESSFNYVAEMPDCLQP